MFSPKDAVLVEWANVKETLRETLRYRYTGSTTREYYEECVSRLDYLHGLVKSISPDAPNAVRELRNMMSQLNWLSTLITYIERSHLEVFSWPFAYALARISTDVCTEKAATGDRIPLFFFQAEGGRTSYAVVPEPKESDIFSRKIFSVVFPRTLKDSALLHAIIGHEIGHGVQTSQPTASSRFADILKRGSVLANQRKLFEWCKRYIGVQHAVDEAYLKERADRWTFEFFSDLFGLVMMGPSFLPAFQALLELNAPANLALYVPRHPPYASRAVALLHAARALKMLYSERHSRDDLAGISRSIDETFVQAASQWNSTPFAILDPDRIAEATIELAKFAEQYNGLAFPAADEQLIAQLIHALRDDVPPVGVYPAAMIRDSGREAMAVDPSVVDFRHILLAGWIHWSEIAEKDGAHFRHINQLCSHAIMQQEGIVYWKKNEATPNARRAS
jgi:hypothetical protein